MLTKRQEQVYECIVRTIEREGRQPSLREIGRQIGVTSPNGVYSHLRALARKGWLVIHQGRAAGLGLPRVRFRRVAV